MNQKWKHAQQIVIDPQIESDEPYTPDVQQKLQRLLKLKEGVDHDENELKLQYITLMRERNEYFRKLKLVQQVCDQNPNTPLVQNIQVLFNTISSKQ